MFIRRMIWTRSDHENQFWCAGQNRQAFSALPDILSPCQTFLADDDWQISVVILVFLVHVVRHFCVFEPAGQNVRQGLSSLPDISRSLPDMSGIFRDHWTCEDAMLQFANFQIPTLFGPRFFPTIRYTAVLRTCKC